MQLLHSSNRKAAQRCNALWMTNSGCHAIPAIAIVIRDHQGLLDDKPREGFSRPGIRQDRSQNENNTGQDVETDQQPIC